MNTLCIVLLFVFVLVCGLIKQLSEAASNELGMWMSMASTWTRLDSATADCSCEEEKEKESLSTKWIKNKKKLDGEVEIADGVSGKLIDKLISPTSCE